MKCSLHFDFFNTQPRHFQLKVGVKTENVKDFFLQKNHTQTCRDSDSKKNPGLGLGLELDKEIWTRTQAWTRINLLALESNSKFSDLAGLTKH